MDAQFARHRPRAVALIIIDHFERIDDRFGHAQGDVVLGATASARPTLQA